MGVQQRAMGSKLMSSFQMLLMFMLPLLAFAQQPTPQPTPSNGNGVLGDGTSIDLTWERIVAGYILLLIGIVLTFRGYRYFRFTMFLTGFIVGCVILYSILANVEPSQGWRYGQVIYLFACIAAGLIIGAICCIFHIYTVWLLGALAGLMVALYILGWRNEGLIRSRGGRIGLLVGASALGLLIGLAFGRRILIPASALIGAYLTVVGIDLFARTGFTQSIKSFFTSNNTANYRLTANLYIMLGVVGGLIILGIVFQSLAYRHRMKALDAQGRTSHAYDKDWSLLGRKRHTVQPDPTYANGGNAYNAGYNPTNAGYNPTNAGYNPTNAGYDAYGASNTGQYDNTATTAYTTEKPKKSWNPFKKDKDKVTSSSATGTTGTTGTTVHSDYPDNRVSYSSNAALNQNSH
ncbi:hypothetical protein EMPS_03236 [Entomortierella parvispora]|uniref:Transmembrane protein 198 n=1 Tax=Entomortierella parvispora TaxID=205924 RepID=A0A9P3LU80_9FUNG|nr:hypothetical protein EMPS_03236 [Entomortierella parvispora]